MKKRVGFLIIGWIWLLLSGCAGGLEKNWALGKGDLPSSVGDMSRIHGASVQASHADNLAELTGYGPMTGKWFLHNGQGKFGYGITTGSVKAGDEVYVKLISTAGEIKLDRDVRIQLSEIKSGWKDRELIVEEIVHVNTVNNDETIFMAKLPETENAAYILSAEILDDAGNAEDTLIGWVYAPKQEINASLTLDRESYARSDQQAVLSVNNAGPTVLFLGTYYTIEKQVGDAWRVVPLKNVAFNDIGIILQPGDAYEQIADISQLKKGQYRIVKEVRADGTELTAELAAQFRIE